MAIYEFQQERIHQFKQICFSDVGLREREDLQRLLKVDIEVVCTDTMVIAEGFSDWEDSRREIDLLAIDKEANLVVIELKRTTDAGHAELQAIRYAAMVSMMTFEKAVEAHADYRRTNSLGGDAAQAILDFLEWGEPDEERFGKEVRIVLVAQNFSKELTTSVMWLNERNMDIRCVRMQPYQDCGKTFVDVQQVIPLPEAQDYIIQIRQKTVREHQDRTGQVERKELRKEFWTGLIERSKGRTPLFANVSPSKDSWIATGAGISSLAYAYNVRRHSSSVRFILCGERASNKARFDYLYNKREEIDAAFGSKLTWDRADEQKESKIYFELDGGYRDAAEEWAAIQDAMIDAMVRLDRAIQPHIEAIRNVS